MEASLLAEKNGPVGPVLGKNKWNDEENPKPDKMPFHTHLEKVDKVVYPRRVIVSTAINSKDVASFPRLPFPRWF